VQSRLFTSCLLSATCRAACATFKHQGILYDVLRFNSKPAMGNFAVLLRFDLPTNKFTFDSIVGMPGGHSKFVIRYVLLHLICDPVCAASSYL
jgi:hypothetical protein